MKKALKALYRRVGESNYGPKPTNPIYEITDADGHVWRVERHYWEYPSSNWAWAATLKRTDGTRDHKYGDTLVALAEEFGYDPGGYLKEESA